jgi:hypothetical protein
MNKLKKERDILNENELKVSQALSEGKGKLDRDERLFEELIDGEVRGQIMRENNVAEFMGQNNDLRMGKKKLLHDYKQLMDDLDKVIKNIDYLKGNATFVHTVLDYPIKFKRKSFYIPEDDNDYDMPSRRIKEKPIDQQVEECL